tara:strand:- start:150 stop:1211 length:1062 start_codon:yes stop_codon:yes gene_type:complete
MISKNIISLSTDFKKTFVNLDQTISHALKSLNYSGARICIVVDKKNLFKGLINDGDIRRALLKGKNLETKIDQIYNKKPIVVKEKFNKNIILKKLKKKGVDQAPIIKNKKVIGIYNVKRSISKNLRIPAVIMAGGMGSRLKPVTNKVPKALVTINKVPMLSKVINNLKKYGFYNFILTTYYKSIQIKNFYKKGKSLNVKIDYVTEKKPLGTAGSLSLLRHKIKEKNFLLTNCDVISEINYRSLIDFHIKNKADLTMAVKKYTTENQFGEINLNGIKIIKIDEKPKKNIIINSAIYILKTKYLKHLKYNQFIDMNDFIMQLIKMNKKVVAFPFYENWFDLGTKEQLKIFKNNFD